jgi:hypothetical protein
MEDVQARIFGITDISVDEIIANTSVSGFERSDRPVVEWLWAWLRRSSNEVRRKFLKFATGLSQVPVDGLGRRIRIQDSVYGDLLPRAKTIFFSLPVYQSEQELEHWMTIAIERSAAGGH